MTERFLEVLSSVVGNQVEAVRTYKDLHSTLFVTGFEDLYPRVKPKGSLLSTLAGSFLKLEIPEDILQLLRNDLGVLNEVVQREGRTDPLKDHPLLGLNQVASIVRALELY